MRTVWTIVDSHVLPVEDLREHDASTVCWCKPFPDPECPVIWVHNSLDRREHSENLQAHQLN